ncbi:GNAT family N-acetyltransferase [Sphingomonas oligophenolica]|uniref:N-acetyltransferase n=1 Tax=Sphingomonas oligophenolica TaxID=301154 RepID=A0A502C9Q7_9SPHN|nr:GNAT family N-acetyltransferase [Sphingomonas oligophenolica]TPG08476.1 N-acetyltransferase [Sphingomonas oligophenolica]
MIETERLILRPWRDEDVPHHHAMCTDPGFMAYLGPPLTLDGAAAAAARQNAHRAATGSCFWAIEHRASECFVGYCGIKPGPDDTPIAGLPEIGWGIAPDRQRHGFAAEAARACLADGWARFDWPTIYAITVLGNVASWGLMERIGMRRAADMAFDHPALAQGDPLRPHITYAIDRPR